LHLREAGGDYLPIFDLIAFITASAVDLLATYLLLHAAHVSYLDTIRKELEQ